jgi:exopolysaccharide biosynthesis polyprenyl glycosylphosphotransferase
VIRRHGGALRALLMITDGVLAMVMGLVVYQGLAHPGTAVESFLDAFWVRALFYGFAWVALLYLNGAYRLRAHWTLAGEVRPVLRATLWLAFLGVVALLLSASDRASSGWVLLLFPLQGLLAILLRGAVRWGFMHLRRRGHNVRNLLVLGTGPDAIEFSSVLSDHSVLGVQVVGYLGDRAPEGVPEAQYWGVFADLPRILQDRVIDEVALCVGEDEWSLVEPLALIAHEEGKLVRVPLHVPRLLASDRELEDLDGVAVLSYSSGPDELVGHALKRAFDISAAVGALVILSPLILGLAALLRVRQGPGVIFRQARVGLHGRPFTIYKFRTMVSDAEEQYQALAERSHTSGAAFKLVDDPRVTSAGRWLRRYSLDELPQFVNVLKGQMSIVGPRPAPPREVEEYDIWHRRRLSMKPGITGLWQITSRLDDDFDDRAELDLAYIDRWSLWLDMAIVLKTVPAVLRKPGH